MKKRTLSFLLKAILILIGLFGFTACKKKEQKRKMSCVFALFIN